MRVTAANKTTDGNQTEGTLKKFLRKLGIVRSNSQPSAPRASSGFHDSLVSRQVLDAARRDRLTDHWNPLNLTASSVHYANANLVRRRARDLVANNPMAEGAIDAYLANVIECGIIPRPGASYDFIGKEDRRKWRDAWERWAAKEADVTGHQHFYELMALWLEEEIVGGGCLVRFYTLGGADMRNRRLPLAVGLLPEERFADDLDTLTMQGAATDGDGRKQSDASRIIRGVEIDNRFGRPRAFWIWRDDPDGMFSTFDGFQKVRVPADDAIYAFFKRRTPMVRGMTLLTPAIMWLYKAGYYVDNELTASAIKSCYAVMIKTGEIGDPLTMFDGDPDGPLRDAFGNPFEKMQPGTVLRGKPEDEISGIGPNVPGGDSQAWIEFIERSIAMAMHLSRSEMFRDTGKSSFSAVRAERASDRKRFTRLQWHCIWHLLGPTWERFVESSVLRGVDGFPSASEFAANRDEFLRTSFGPPGWESVNPKDDAQADEIHLRNRTKTRAEIISYRGEEAEEVFEQTAEEEWHLAELGLTPQLAGAAQPMASDTPSSEQTPGNADDANPTA